MRIIQIMPAHPGTQAVYVDLSKDEGFLTFPVQMYGLVVDPETNETWVDGLDYTDEGFVPIADIGNCLGLLFAGEKVEEQFGELEKKLRAELKKTTDGAN